MKDQILDKPAFMQKESVFAGIKSSEYDKFDQICNQTMVGFVQKIAGGDSLDKHKI